MWRTFVREYLRFSRKERLGIGMLVLVMLLTSYLPDLFFYFQRRSVAGSDDLKAAVLAFESQLAMKTLQDKDESQPAMNKATGYLFEKEVAPVLFYFDPNTLPPDRWQQLGVSERTARTIGKYLAKGGHFRVAADLEKVYGLPPALCAQLIPYVRIKDSKAFSGRDVPRDRRYDSNRSDGVNSSQGFNDNRGFAYSRSFSGSRGFPHDSDFTGRRGFTGDQSGYYHGHTPDSSFTRYRKKAPPIAIDINVSDSTVWQSLPGIGPGFARRIIAFRERLGGFYAVEQVAECYGLPDSVFQKIQPFLQIGSSSLKKLDLNGSDEKSLAAHPYIRYKLARLIVQYRSSHAGFKEVADLRSLPLVDEIIYRKIEHYIEIKY